MPFSTAHLDTLSKIQHMPNLSEPYEPPVSRVIDFRIPLPYLISGFCALAFTLVSMYFSLNQLLREVGDLQVTVKAGNTQSVTLAGEQALLRFRMENIEGEIRQIKKTGEAPVRGSR